MFANSLFASISSISHFILLLGLAFCRARHIIYSLCVTMTFIRSAVSQTRFVHRSGLPPPSPHLSMPCSSVAYLSPSSLPTFPLRSISSLILLLPTSLVSSVPDFPDIPFYSPLGLAFRCHRVWCRPYHLFLSSSCITTAFIRFAAPPFSLLLFLPVSPSLSWID